MKNEAKMSQLIKSQSPKMDEFAQGNWKGTQRENTSWSWSGNAASWNASSWSGSNSSEEADVLL